MRNKVKYFPYDNVTKHNGKHSHAQVNGETKRSQSQIILEKSAQKNP